MASVSGTSSLGNTALRGYGGMATGIDRDAIIEQMTLNTTNKITNKENDMTQLEWKQEAYRSIADKIIDIQDNYFSYAGTNSLKNGSIFEKNVITAQGDSDSTKFVHASGSSDMIDYVSILGVKQLASSATQQSKAWVNGITTSVTSIDQQFQTSRLRGAQLQLGVWNPVDNRFDSTQTFTFSETYTDDNGKTHTIDYTQPPKDLADELNAALKSSSIKIGDTLLSDAVRFVYDEGSDAMRLEEIDGKFTSFGYSINSNSSALTALGYNKDNSRDKDGVSLSEYNGNLSAFSSSYVGNTSLSGYAMGTKVTFNYNGSKKEVELLTADDVAALKGMSGQTQMEEWANRLQSRLEQAFGTGSVKVTAEKVTGADGGDQWTLAFAAASDTSTLSVSSEDPDLMKALGLESGVSTKVNLSQTLDKANLGITEEKLQGYMRDNGNGGQELDLTINGVQIHGLTAESSVQDIIDKINATTEAGVKATYVDTTGQFVLIASETGKGRQIDLGDAGTLAKDLFGNMKDGQEVGFSEGKDAIITVSYGNSVSVDLERANNTFDLEGMSVTVIGTFGYTNGVLDSSKAVSFSAEADVDAAVETVKKFFEDYNALATEVNTQLTTRHDSSYGPLTDDQKAEMSEESIKNWENKAKQGLLNNDSILWDLNSGLGNIYLQMMQNGVSTQDLEDIGITYSDDSTAGGTLVFNETAFRQAMEEDPEKVARIFNGKDGVSQGLVQITESTLRPYATRYASQNGGSYGRLVEQAGSEKVPLSAMDNFIYKQLKEMQSQIEDLRSRLKSEQDRYISQFTAMETAISQMNSQASWLSSLQG